ncbi:MAG: hypothetical protein V4591_04225 [Bdellovibrionota bacterium]
MPFLSSLLSANHSATTQSIPNSFKKNDTGLFIDGKELPSVCKDNILKIYSDFIAPTNYVFHASVPPVFKKISQWVKSNSTEELFLLVRYLKDCENLLQKPEIQQFICEKKDCYTWEKYNENTLVALQYIRAFYEIDGEEKFVNEKSLTCEHLITCFEGAKKLQALKNGETIEIPKEDYLLSVSGQCALSCFQRVLSVDTASTLLLTSMMDSAPIGAMLDAKIPWPLTGSAHMAASSAAVTLAGGIFMMIGFAGMTSFDKSMEYRFVLQKMLLGDVYDRVSKAGGGQVEGLTTVTWDAIRALLLDSKQKKQIAKNNSLKTSTHLTSADKKHLFKQFLNTSSSTLDYSNLCSQFTEIVLVNKEQHQQELLSTLSTTVFKHKNKWGTALDHIFAKVSKECKQEIIEDLKVNKLFGFDIISQKIDLPQEFNKSIAYVYNIMRVVPWRDRINGSLAFSKLMFEIYTSDFDEGKKLFLLKMLSQGLQEKERGEFAPGKIKRGNFIRNGVVSFGYLVQAAFCLGASFLHVSSLAYSLGSVATGAYGAITFGMFTAVPYYGSTASHESKKSAVKGAQIFYKEEKDDIQLQYESFLLLCQQLKSTDDEIKREEICEEIISNIRFFEEQGISDFILESCHGSKNCPLFEIVRELLAPKNKKNLPQLEKVYKILQAAYNEKNGKLWQALPQDVCEEEKFQIFMSQGLSSVNLAKQKFLFCLQCQAKLSSMSEGASKKNCEEIFEKALKNAEADKGSLMFNLQKRAEKKYHSKKAIGRIFSNLLTSGLGLAVTLLIGAFAPHLFLIGVFVCFFLVCIDFAIRKQLERLAYSKNYKYYTIMKKFSCPAPGNTEEIITPSAKDTLGYISKKYEPTNIRSFLAELAKGRSAWELEEDGKKLANIKNETDLRQALLLLTQQHIDKENISKSLLRALWLIFSCTKEKNGISPVLQEKILCEQTTLYCFRGKLANMLRTKKMTGQDRYLLLDAFAGGLTALLPLINIIPGVTSFQTTSLLDGSSTQSLAQCWHSYVTQACLDTTSFWLWSQYFDVSEFGKTTASCQNALGCFKKALFLVRESIEKDDNKEERLFEVGQFVSAILQCHKTVNPINSLRKTKTTRGYKKLYPCPRAC